MVVIQGWFDDLFGEARFGKRHGALAQFFTQFERFFTHMVFSRMSLFNLTSQKKALIGPIDHVKPIDPGEIQKIFKKLLNESPSDEAI